MARKLTSIKLDEELLERSEALVPFVKSMPAVAAGGEVTRSTVIRLALMRGLESLEAEAGAGRGKRKR